jgi:hypothetical protein
MISKILSLKDPKHLINFMLLVSKACFKLRFFETATATFQSERH